MCVWHVGCVCVFILKYAYENPDEHCATVYFVFKIIHMKLFQVSILL